MTAFLLLIKRDLRDTYGTRWAVLGDIATMLFTMSVYFFTGKAFSSPLSESLREFGGDYFTYVLVGHVALLIPTVLFVGIPYSLRRSAAEGSLDLVLAEPASPQLVILLSSLATLPREIARVIFLLLAARFLFSVSVPPLRLLGAVGILALSLPAIFGMGLIASAIWVRVGRGVNVVDTLNSLFAALAGSYFPVSILPPPLRDAAKLASPFSTYLGLVRSCIASGWRADQLPPALALFALGVILFAGGYLALGASFANARNEGRILLAAA